MATLLFKRIDHVYIIYHSLHNPSDSEWETCMQAAARDLENYNCIIVYSDGGGPNSAQRARMAKEDFNRVPTVVMTDSMLVRGIIIAMTWLGRTSRAFRRDQLDPVAEHLKLSSELRDRVADAFTAMRAQAQSKVA